MAGQVKVYLLALGPEVARVSTSQVKKDLKLTKAATGTWQRAWQSALSELAFSWTVEGRSFVRVEG